MIFFVKFFRSWKTRFGPAVLVDVPTSMAPAKVGTVLGNPKNAIHKGGPLHDDDDDQFFQNLQDDDNRDQVARPQSFVNLLRQHVTRRHPARIIE